MVEQHAIFQGYYFFHHLGMNRDMRERFRGHPSFDHTAEFCALYDGPAFDPRKETLPLSYFEPMVQRPLDAYRALAANERAAVDRALAGTGCGALLAHVPRYRLGKRRFKLVFEAAT